MFLKYSVFSLVVPKLPHNPNSPLKIKDCRIDPEVKIGFSRVKARQTTTFKSPNEENRIHFKTSKRFLGQSTATFTLSHESQQTNFIVSDELSLTRDLTQSEEEDAAVRYPIDAQGRLQAPLGPRRSCHQEHRSLQGALHHHPHLSRPQRFALR